MIYNKQGTFFTKDEFSEEVLDEMMNPQEYELSENDYSIILFDYNKRDLNRVIQLRDTVH